MTGVSRFCEPETETDMRVCVSPDIYARAAAASVRGYAGSIRPVEAYDAVLSGGNIVVVDVRRDNEASRGDIEFPRRYSNKVLQVGLCTQLECS
jgi:hypothetical protein